MEIKKLERLKKELLMRYYSNSEDGDYNYF